MKNRSLFALFSITIQLKNPIHFLSIILLFFSCKPDIENKDQTLFNRFFEPLAIPKSFDQLGFSQTDVAYGIYHQKDYKEAIVNFKYALIDNPNNNELKLYLGISFLKTGNVRQAEKLLAKIIEQGNEEKQEIAKWYLALLFLKDNKVSSKNLLSQLFASKNYGSKAKELHSLI